MLGNHAVSWLAIRCCGRAYIQFLMLKLCLLTSGRIVPRAKKEDLIMAVGAAI